MSLGNQRVCRLPGAPERWQVLDRRRCPRNTENLDKSRYKAAIPSLPFDTLATKIAKYFERLSKLMSVLIDPIGEKKASGLLIVMSTNEPHTKSPNLWIH
uniref:Uncharacterized protein n=1 Tax=Tetranychus urticae TaxID=32264 RepID=T1K613_TETUR